MRRLFMGAGALAVIVAFAACEPDRPVVRPGEEEPAEPVQLAEWVPSTRSEDLQDGTYRGWFGDGGEMQVNVQFSIEDNEITVAGFRYLGYDGTDYLNSDQEVIAGITEQHRVALESLVGEDPRIRLGTLYDPGSVVGDEYDVDGFTGATIRGNKIVYAVRDGLNRGVYRFDNGIPGHYYPVRGESFQDGTYRGVFEDRQEMQVNVQFTTEDNVISAIRFRHLAYSDTDFIDTDDETIAGLRDQHIELIEYLEGRDVRTALRDLYEPGEIVGPEHDIDGMTGATLRSTKVISAIRDGLNRGVYGFAGDVPEGYRNVVEESFEDGVYRGTFADGGEMQVNVQFTLEDNVVTSARFRHLAYRGLDYRDDHDDPIAGIARQHEAALEHLVDRDIRGTLRDLYTPGDIVGDEYDVDGYTGATIRATKIRSAARDALNSGPYTLAD